MEIYRQKRSSIFEDLTSSSLSSSPRAQKESAVHLSVRPDPSSVVHLSVRPDPSPVSSPSHRHWTKRGCIVRKRAARCLQSNFGG
ncbi:unnamed protein product [Cuscuta campestris]|uniref:Uncharacterized protein n=1 Tax=Cuscuta campestris TaxID=132261 RepID=A0A484MW05_9ASTE|nr:unnamed protein product [Cuscuta campestris]